MTRIKRLVREWNLNENRLSDGAEIGGFQTLKVTNLKTSDFAVKVRFDGAFKFGLNPGEDHTEEVDGRDILVTVHPAIEKVGPGQEALGDFILD